MAETKNTGKGEQMDDPPAPGLSEEQRGFFKTYPPLSGFLEDSPTPVQRRILRNNFLRFLEEDKDFREALGRVYNNNLQNYLLSKGLERRDIEAARRWLYSENSVSRRTFLRTAAGLGAALIGIRPPAAHAYALRISDSFSPRNRGRAERPYTKYIILHTTEGGFRGSFRKLKRRGEAHYLVNTNGKVYRLIDRRRIAKHAGRSMWDGNRNIDNYSIGIEVVGYHNKHLTDNQYRALGELLRQLQSIYGISDGNVLTHSMIAYGAPNRYHRYNHRGRKRCAMIMAKLEVRRRLGLNGTPRADPDVRAGRLRVADSYLFEVLYGGRQVASSSEEVDQGQYEEGFRTLKKDETAYRVAGSDYSAPTTIYFLDDGRVRRGDELDERTFTSLPPGTKMLVGYMYGGHISRGRSASSIVGTGWNYPSTLYRFPDGNLVSGDELDDSSIPPMTLVLFRN